MSARPFRHRDDEFVYDDLPPADELAIGDQLVGIGFPIDQARIAASRAPAAFRARRLELERKHGPQACTSLDRDPRDLARDLIGRARAIGDHLAGGGTPAGDQLEAAIASLKSAGAIAEALYDRLGGQ